MLELLRALSKTWIAKILLAVLVVSFGAFGISNVITDLGSNTIAHVGSIDITTKQFQRAYQNALQRVSQQTGQLPTSQQAMAMGIPAGVLQQLASQAALKSVAQKYGLGASQARLAKMLRDDPSFAGSTGNFDRNTFEAILRQNGYTDAEFFNEEMADAQRSQLEQALFGDAAIPETAQHLLARYIGDTRTLDYFVVNDTVVGDIAPPTEKELKAYLKAHQSDYRTDESRTIDILSFSPETIAAKKSIPEDQVKAAYEKEKSSLTKVETRHVEQVILPDDKAVAAVKAGEDAGKTLDQIAKDNSLSVVDLGTMSKAQITDQSLADAAFKLPLNGIAVIPGISGQRAITVTAINAGGTKSFDEAKDEIAKQLALNAAKTEYATDLDQIEALRAAFKPLGDIAKRFNLDVEHIELTRAGDALKAVPAIADKDRQKIVDAVFKAKPKSLTPMIPLAGNQNVFFDLDGVQQARDQTLAEVHDKVAAAWTAEKTQDAIDAKVKALNADLKSGKSFDDVAAEINALPQLSEPITRNGNGTPVLDHTVADAAFGGPQGFTGSAKDSDGDYVMFKVDSVTPMNSKAPEQTRTYLANAMKTDLFTQYLTGVRNDAGLRVNQGALDQLLAVNGQ